MINVIHNLIEMFLEPGAAEADRLAAIELRMILLLDPTAQDDLVRALFAGQKFDCSNASEFQRVMDILNVYGAVEQRFTSKDLENFDVKFNARPLIDILKRMSHRDPNNGCSKAFIHRHFANAPTQF